MKTIALPALTLAIFIVTNINGPLSAAPIKKEEVEYQDQNFKQWWGIDLVWQFDKLPAEGTVPKTRMPYSGYIYPDRGRGTAAVLGKYDTAFNGGSLASSYERNEILGSRERRGGRSNRRFVGLFARSRVPHWAGHCNGWTAAAIRHAEPEKNVVRNGVVFTPADIKGLLAELYTFTESEFLGGIDPAINPGTFHVIIANWLGVGSYPIGMDNTIGREVWNYPLYAYNSTFDKKGDRQVEVKINVGYIDSTEQEYNSAPVRYQHMYMHYLLDLTKDGQVAGGQYYGDSNRIDMLWAPLQPTQGGEKGNKEGNPHISAKEILSMWRESAPEEARKTWFNVDPTKEDRILDETEVEAEMDASV